MQCSAWGSWPGPSAWQDHTMISICCSAPMCSRSLSKAMPIRCSLRSMATSMTRATILQMASIQDVQHLWRQSQTLYLEGAEMMWKLALPLSDTLLLHGPRSRCGRSWHVVSYCTTWSSRARGNFQCSTLNHMNGWLLLQMLITMCLPHFLLFPPGVKKSWDSNTHHQLQNDLVEHLWTLKGGD